MKKPTRAEFKQLRAYGKTHRFMLVSRSGYLDTIWAALRHGIRTPNNVLVHTPRDYYGRCSTRHPDFNELDALYGPLLPHASGRVYVVWGDEPVEQIIAALEWLRVHTFIPDRYVVRATLEDLCLT